MATNQHKRTGSHRRSRGQASHQRRRAKPEISAGGIVYLKRRGVVKLVLLLTEHRKGERRFTTWRLPKGHPNPAEPLLAAARREVAEETGVLGTGGPKLGTANFFFTHPVTKEFIHKYVHYYLFKKKSGSVDQHDREYDTARWFSVAEALKVASFKNDKVMIQRAARLIKQRQKRGQAGILPRESFEADEEEVRFIRRPRRPHD